MENKTCRIPVKATYTLENGVMKRTAAEYKDIPADVIARFLIQKFGRDAIFKGVED